MRYINLFLRIPCKTVLLVGCLTVWVQPTCIVKAHLWACSKSLQIQISHLLRNDQDLWEVWLLLMRSDHKCVVHAEEKEKKEEKGKGHSVLWEELKQESYFRQFLCEFQREQDIEKERASAWVVQSEWRDRKKHSESVREWKRKRRYFSLLKLHTRKINWWSSHAVFECYNHRELEYSEEDFATGFVVRVYLLLEIYLLYIDFIVDSSLT